MQKHSDGAFQLIVLFAAHVRQLLSDIARIDFAQTTLSQQRYLLLNPTVQIIAIARGGRRMFFRL